jgi:hypothetical protein
MRPPHAVRRNSPEKRIREERAFMARTLALRSSAIVFLFDIML